MAINQREQTHKTMHALRQPLNALRLTLANLRHRISVDGSQFDKADTMTKLQKMDEQIQRMADLIDTLLVTKEDTDS